MAAQKQPDGSLVAPAINVGRDGARRRCNRIKAEEKELNQRAAVSDGALLLREEVMTTMKMTLAGVLLAASCTIASAQQAQTQRVMGTIEAVNGQTLTVRSRDGETKVTVTDNVTVFGVAKATLADLKPGSFVGVGAMPQPDGSQKAIRVMIFAESQRGTGEGHRPWVQPGSTMTNATIETTVGSVDGQTLMVKYKDGEKKIIVPRVSTFSNMSSAIKASSSPAPPS